MSSVGDIQKVKLNEICRFFGPDSTVSEIADMMDLQDIGAVPIINEYKQLMGVVSERDIKLQAKCLGETKFLRCRELCFL